MPPATFRSDHNVTDGRFSTNLGSGPLKSLAQWRTATGQDAHSSTATGTQLFVNAAGNDYHLKVGAPALDVGAGYAFRRKFDYHRAEEGYETDEGAPYVRVSFSAGF